ncbi:molybdenum cofactor synthesis 2 [Vararia minispora EC-137]|uniref:Molybdenum cofactor synthesis 2 n=1 Tax=Vararia minispora EC-137 TaxID=1314806 RepID=A0ACB8QMB2_9AGAM|nr:molybdenum cofactor synthesis 2 [Vararia minispora EC-137]
MDNPSVSVDGHLETENCMSVLTHEPLDIAKIVASVGDDAAGATAVFIGTTRNSFKGKVVTRLEYQAYTKLALKTMNDILQLVLRSLHQTSPNPVSGAIANILHATIHHRIGEVPVGEPSIVIAVSSPHRSEAFTACEQILEEVKTKAQVWKREYYEGEPEETAVWKENY